MSLEDLKSANASDIPIVKLIALIARSQAIYLNHHLQEFGISSTHFHLLFEISNECNINQESISKRCNINKGAVARAVKKLEDKGLVRREIDENNRRQNKLSLTKEGEEILKKSKSFLAKWEDEIILEDGYVEKELLQKVLKKIAIKTMELNEGERNG
jgi:DNA-binding MarR family transcriptional regulator